MKTRKTITVKKAEDAGGVIISITEETIHLERGDDSLSDWVDRANSDYLKTSQTIEAALRENLSGGVYDRLAALMLMNKASIFIVPIGGEVPAINVNYISRLDEEE